MTLITKSDDVNLNPGITMKGDTQVPKVIL